MPKSAPASETRYWLFKSEPDSYSIDDLKKDKSTFWSGVRNYQARNMLRDDIQVGDGVLFYHSSTEPMAIVGCAKVAKAGYADHTAFDPKDSHYDIKSKPDEPTWYMVDVKFVEKFATPLTREMLKEDATLSKMVVMQKGSRLSIQPVTKEQWDRVLKLAGAKAW